MLIAFVDASCASATAVRSVFVDSVITIEESYYSYQQKLAWIKGADNDDYWYQYLQSHQVLGAWNDDRNLVGILSYQSACCYVDMLFVTPSYQGQGVSYRLWQVLMNHYYSQKQPRIFTHASKAGKPFFLKIGFDTLQKRQVYRYGEYLSQYWMMRPAQNATKKL